jgi:hypothetical protein
MEINMKLKKSDLERIGSSTCQHEGKTNFYCDVDTANIEEIFLRNILEHLGYRITSEDEATLNPSSDSTDSTVFCTTLPWAEYMELSDDS